MFIISVHPLLSVESSWITLSLHAGICLFEFFLEFPGSRNKSTARFLPSPKGGEGRKELSAHPGIKTQDTRAVVKGHNFINHLTQNLQQ